MLIRKSRFADRKQLFSLFEKLHKKRFNKISIEFKAKPISLVSEEDGKLVGFIWGNYLKYAAFRYVIIEDLFVEKEFRNKNIGRKLIEELVKESRRLGAHEIFVTTEKENRNAIELYSKSGFKKFKNPWFLYRL